MEKSITPHAFIMYFIAVLETRVGTEASCSCGNSTIIASNVGCRIWKGDVRVRQFWRGSAVTDGEPIGIRAAV